MVALSLEKKFEYVIIISRTPMTVKNRRIFPVLSWFAKGRKYMFDTQYASWNRQGILLLFFFNSGKITHSIKNVWCWGLKFDFKSMFFLELL